MSKVGGRFALSCAILTAVGGCTLLAPSHHRAEDYTPIFASADACDTAQVRQAIIANPTLLSATGWDHATLLHESADHRCGDLTRYLLEKGANPNATKSDGITPLHLAAQRGDMSAVELLLAHHARTNPVDARGWTPLDMARHWDHPDVVAYLRLHGGVSRGR